MAKTIGRFEHVTHSPKQGEHFSPVVNICSKRHRIIEGGLVLLSPDLMSEKEIDDHIQDCKEDLDHVGRLAKQALRREHKRIRDRAKGE